MRMIRKRICMLFIAGAVLLLSGCAGTVREEPADTSAKDVAIAASFSREDGIALCDSTVRFSYGESLTDYPLDDNGELRASGLPRDGDLSLTVLDQQEQARGGMTLSLSEGAVIDATTDAGGVGHITLRKDTDEVKLLFVLKNDGSLLCSLQLTEPDSKSFDLLQEDNERER